jgi:hypothetical protein
MCSSRTRGEVLLRCAVKMRRDRSAWVDAMVGWWMGGVGSMRWDELDMGWDGLGRFLG